MLVKLINTDNKVFVPEKKYVTDAGYDCRARLSEPLVIEPGKRACIPLGFGINIPLNHTGDLRPRSGLARDFGIMVGYGTIDVGYTGEVMATVFNFGDEAFVINPEDRIAQLVVLPLVRRDTKYELTGVKEVDELVELERGANGHGSTGVK
jgi:dUTP pyrophosphatase